MFSKGSKWNIQTDRGEIDTSSLLNLLLGLMKLALFYPGLIERREYDKATAGLWPMSSTSSVGKVARHH